MFKAKVDLPILGRPAITLSVSGRKPDNKASNDLSPLDSPT